MVIFDSISIMQVMMDKIYLLNSWPFLVKNLKKIVQDLQSKAKCVFEEEQATSPIRLVNCELSSLAL